MTFIFKLKIKNVFFDFNLNIYIIIINKYYDK